jgi:ribA/ribD-fused uncharacterized protein
MIKFFGNRGPYGFLSNFHEAIFQLDQQNWPSVEHYYQAAKAVNDEERYAIIYAERPYLAKRLGKTCECRTDWEQVVGTPALHKLFKDNQGVIVELVKDHYMFSALIAKFTQRKELKDALLLTGDQEIIEASPSDYYWGIGKNSTGLNKLGRMLQLIRAREREQLTEWLPDSV